MKFESLKTFANKHKYDPIVGGLAVASGVQAIGTIAAGAALVTGLAPLAMPALIVAKCKLDKSQEPEETEE